MQVGRGGDTEKIRLGTKRGGRESCRFGLDTFLTRPMQLRFKMWWTTFKNLGLFVCCSHVKELDFGSLGGVKPPPSRVSLSK